MTVERQKTCAKCAQPKPWAQYHVKVRWSDGTVRQPHSRCKKCQAASRDQKKVWSELKADPEKRAVERDRRRERYRRVNGVTPDKYRPVRTLAPGEHDRRLPVEPFGQWLSTLGESSADIAMNAGMNDRKVRVYLNGESRTVPFNVADRAVQHAEGDTTLEDIWGSLLRDCA